MASVLSPYLNFDGNALEAMEFYRDALGGDLEINTYGEMGETGPLKDKIMHSRLQTGAGFTIMASDLPPGMEHDPGQNVTLSITGQAADAEEIRGYWRRLSESGTVTMPLEKQVWGDEFGSCIDRFGIPWMVDFGTEEPQ
ncbi:VOC family protein [Glycomyces xiaoerkulensis]|uniref:VOC family protein n=1 Tax=Glycomyces xiaoerkulensis TaxID=2038139 RepID=UPI000C25F574|nr:VOC family protein [Glycomyces xiaoerkulensis]